MSEIAGVLMSGWHLGRVTVIHASATADSVPVEIFFLAVIGFRASLLLSAILPRPL